MSKIKAAFEKKGKMFIPFITAGDPSIEATEKYIQILDKAGAGIIEIGVPFSDPIAEGEVIQDANIRALKNNVTTDDVFDMCLRLIGKISAPLVFLTYLNPVFVFGYDKFFSRCKESGVSGVIIPDCPYEESKEFLPFAKKHGVENITLIAPTSEERIKMLCREAEGFVYLVSSMGVTGVRQSIENGLGGVVKKIRQFTDIPVCVGFGISTPTQATDIAKICDGVIVGSAIVKIIKEYGENAAPHLKQYIGEMVRAVVAAQTQDGATHSLA